MTIATTKTPGARGAIAATSIAADNVSARARSFSSSTRRGTLPPSCSVHPGHPAGACLLCAELAAPPLSPLERSVEKREALLLELAAETGRKSRTRSPEALERKNLLAREKRAAERALRPPSHRVIKWNPPRLVTHEGRTQSVAAWAAVRGLLSDCVYRRIKAGATPEQALGLAPPPAGVRWGREQAEAAE